MGYLSCRSHSAIATSDSQTTNLRKPNSKLQTNPSDLRHFRYEELETATAGFSPKNLLGKGSHGCVYRALVDAGKFTVAVKKSMPATVSEDSSAACESSSNSNESPGENEIQILSRIRNPRFVNLLGFSLDEKRLIVVEYMPNGTLYDQLHSRPRPPGWARRVQFAMQIAKAVEMLHALDPPVIHRDIKSSNVLIDENWNARLGDFGLAVSGHLKDLRLRSTPPPAGTLGYIDPGYVLPENLSTKSDVFSYGILLLEIISGRNAIDVNYSPPSVVDWAVPLIKRAAFDPLFDARLGPPKDPLVGRLLGVLATRCVRLNVDERPSMVEVVNCLKGVRKRVPLPIWDDLTIRLRNKRVSNVQGGVVESN